MSTISGSNSLSHIVINSSGADDTNTLLVGWQSALQLAVALKHTSINIVHLWDTYQQNNPDKHNSINSNENSIQAVSITHEQLIFLASLGISEQDLLTRCQASHTLGTQYINWHHDQQNFAMIDGVYGANFNQVEFQHYYAKQQLKHSLNQSSLISFDEYSIAATMAKTHRFIHPAADKRSILSTYRYGLNLELHSFINLLREQALKLGVIETQGQLTQVNLDNNDMIQGVDLMGSDNNLAQIHTDFLIECTNKATSITPVFSDDDGSFNCNIDNHQTFFTLAVHNEQHNIDEVSIDEPSIDKLSGNKLSIDQLTSEHFGWWKLKQLIKQRVIEGIFSNGTNILDVIECLNKQGYSVNEADFTLSPITNTRVSQMWRKNYLRIGSAAFNIEPLFINPLSIAYADISRWLVNLPQKTCPTILSHYYNQQTQASYNSIKDYLFCHYLMSQHRQENLNNASAELAHLLALFKQTATLPLYEHQVVEKNTWISFLLGCQYWPENIDPLAAQLSDQQQEAKLESLRLNIAGFAQKIPTYCQYLSDHGFN